MNDSTNSRYRYLAFISPKEYRRYVPGDDNGNMSNTIAPPAEKELPTHGSYAAALFRPEWKSKRAEIINRDAGSCIICKKSNNLHVHHRQYHFVIKENRFKLPWEYPDHLLITLCESCHNRGHNKYKVPIINV